MAIPAFLFTLAFWLFLIVVLVAIAAFIVKHVTVALVVALFGLLGAWFLIREARP